MQCLVWDLCKHLFLPLSGYPYQISCANSDSSFSVCILSIIQLWGLQTFGLTADPTWDNFPTTFWSTLETTCGRHLCLHAFHSWWVCSCHPKFWQTSVNNSAMSSQKISMGCIGLSPSDPSSKSWPAKELGSKSTLDRIDEEAHLHENSVIVTTKPDSRLISKFYSTPDLMKPLPIPGSRTSHISSLKR
jgi:hypothetical protein